MNQCLPGVRVIVIPVLIFLLSVVFSPGHTADAGIGEILDEHMKSQTIGIPPPAGQGSPGQVCVGKFSLPQHVKPGDTNHIIVHLRSPGSNVIDEIDSVVVETPDGSAPATFKMRFGLYAVYGYDWKVPELSADASISFFAYRGGELLCSGTTLYKPLTSLEVVLQVPASLKVGEEGSFSCRVKDGKPPYSITWYLAGETRKDTVQYENAESFQNKSFASKGWKVVTVTASDQSALRGGDADKVPVFKKELKVLINGPSTIEAGSMGTWEAGASGGTPPYKYTFKWSDGVQGSGSTTSRALNYSPDGYFLEFLVDDADDLPGYMRRYISVKKPSVQPGCPVGTWDVINDFDCDGPQYDHEEIWKFLADGTWEKWKGTMDCGWDGTWTMEGSTLKITAASKWFTPPLQPCSSFQFTVNQLCSGFTGTPVRSYEESSWPICYTGTKRAE